MILDILFLNIIRRWKLASSQMVKMPEYPDRIIQVIEEGFVFRLFSWISTFCRIFLKLERQTR